MRWPPSLPLYAAGALALLARLVRRAGGRKPAGAPGILEQMAVGREVGARIKRLGTTNQGRGDRSGSRLAPDLPPSPVRSGPRRARPGSAYLRGPWGEAGHR